MEIEGRKQLSETVSHLREDTKLLVEEIFRIVYENEKIVS
jgi:hypothetical protein